MHDCIAQLCVQFYYGIAGGGDILARRFPENFRNAIPEYAVALAATCVSDQCATPNIIDFEVITGV